MTVVRHAAAALCALALGTGCAAVQANRRSPGSISNGAFTPGRPGAAQFGPNPALLCPTGGAFPILASDAAELARDAKRAVPEGDGRLCAVADALLGWNEPGSPPESVTSFLAWHHGLPATPPRVLVASIESEDPRIVAQRLLDAVNSFASTAVAPRFGAVTNREKKGLTKTVVVLYDALVELDPLPRRVEAGAQARCVGGWRRASPSPGSRCAILPASWRARPPATAAKAQPTLACGPKPGLLLVEVRAERDGEAVSAARFPVMCGAELPASVQVPPAARKGGEIVAGTDRKVFDLVNGERSAAGVTPLEWTRGWRRSRRPPRRRRATSHAPTARPPPSTSTWSGSSRRRAW